MADEIDALVETVQPAGPEAVLDCARPKAGGEKLRSRYDTVLLGRQRGDCAFAVIVGFPLYMEGNPAIVWTAPVTGGRAVRLGPMKAKLIHQDEQRTYALVFDRGDEAMEGLRSFASEHGLAAAQFTGIGAFSDVVLGYFDWERKEFEEIRLDEQVEVLTLAGDVAVSDGEPQVHAHVAVSKRDGTAHGGHLMSGHVRPTLEVILVESPDHLRKRLDAETGLALIDLDD